MECDSCQLVCCPPQSSVHSPAPVSVTTTTVPVSSSTYRQVTSEDVQRGPAQDPGGGDGGAAAARGQCGGQEVDAVGVPTRQGGDTVGDICHTL